MGFRTIVIMLLFCCLCSCSQEEYIFHPRKTHGAYRYQFGHDFREYFLEVEPGVRLNCLLFKSRPSKGLIFYLHGNAGSLDSWGHVAAFYLQHKYDVFLFDYRGFGKSDGTISGEAQIYRDIEKVYGFVRKEYDEKKIVILGYSIGTGMAAYLGAKNKPGMVVLLAPYYNLPDLVGKHLAWVPSFLIKYKFPTDRYIPRISSPVAIFHGTDDEVIPCDSSVRLSRLMKQADRFVILKGQGHIGIESNKTYEFYMEKLLK